jgi:predicted dehydrogenase
VKTPIGVIGCGYISGIYFKNCKQFENIEVAACADLDMDRARARAIEFDIPRVLTVEEMLADPDVQVVVNLTTPDAHGSVGLATVKAGKSVYNEKPLAIYRADAQAMLAGARANQVLVGGAPDTFLGAGLQTCRDLIDRGVIGEPVAVTAFFMNHGPEHWHPNPGFYYQAGAGPMFDMGPYYLTAIVSMLGPVQRVTGSARVSQAERLITSEPLNGTKVTVNTPTHVTGVLDFASGVIGTIITSFDVWGHHVPNIEIHGTEGSLSVPDPNIFGGPVMLRHGRGDWEPVPVTRAYSENSRGLGVADLAAALQSGRAHRANGELAYHVLDIMHAIHDSSRTGTHIELGSTCQRPAPLPADLAQWAMDA